MVFEVILLQQVWHQGLGYHIHHQNHWLRATAQLRRGTQIFAIGWNGFLVKLDSSTYPSCVQRERDKRLGVWESRSGQKRYIEKSNVGVQRSQLGFGVMCTVRWIPRWHWKGCDWDLKMKKCGQAGRGVFCGVHFRLKPRRTVSTEEPLRGWRHGFWKIMGKGVPWRHKNHSLMREPSLPG